MAGPYSTNQLNKYYNFPFSLYDTLAIDITNELQYSKI